jgi:UDPglucose--hexose-1-phosphate uridylyltransferase
MSQIRRDPITGRIVIVAEARAERPCAFVAGFEPRAFARDQSSFDAPRDDCPFCPGNEHETPAEVFALRDRATAANTAGWQVRVVTNKYPALVPFEVAATGQNQTDESFARGIHEVIIDTPRHVTTVGQLSAEELRAVLDVYRLRLATMANDAHIKHALILKNVGRAAGATIEHLHSQLVATEFVPTAVDEELAACDRHFRQYNECAFCGLIRYERLAETRIVNKSPRFIALSPFAARVPFETWILPRRHSPHFHSQTGDDLADLATFSLDLLRRIERLSQPTAYNLWIHAAPFDSVAIESYHWHVEIAPRMTTVAGYELGTGCFINPVSPERAAANLRELGSAT